MKKKVLALVTTIVMIFASLGFITGCGEKPEKISAPTITLAYDSVTLGKGATYDLLDGVTVTDAYDSALKATVSDNGGFNNGVAGTYTITYSAKNSKGKEMTTTRSVKVAEGAALADGAVVKKGCAFVVPSYGTNAVTVSYKADGAEDWTTLEKTGDVYLLDLAAGAYSVKYATKKGETDASATVDVTVYELAAPAKSVCIFGQNVTLPLPAVSENVTPEIKVYAKAGDAEYAEIVADKGEYKLELTSEGAYTLKYDVTINDVTETLTADLVSLKAGLASTATDKVTAAGEVTVRTPETSEGVTAVRTVTKVDYENSEATVTDGKITVAEGELYIVEYSYTYDNLDLGSDKYMIYYQKDVATMLDFSNWNYTPYEGALVDTPEKYALNGTGSLHVRWYKEAMGNWHGYTGCNIDMGEDVGKVTFYAHAPKDFVNHVGLWVSCKDASGGGVSNDYSKPVGADTVDYILPKAGWHKYTLDLKCTFRTLNTFTFYALERDKADAGDEESGLYIDGMYFHA